MKPEVLGKPGTYFQADTYLFSIPWSDELEHEKRECGNAP